MSMDARKFRILQAIIDDYILTAIPVGSRTISKKYEMGLSSATIRDRLRGRTEDLRNVAQRSYTAGVAEFSMESALPPEELSEALVLNPPEGLRLQVLEVGGGRIQARLVAQ